MVSDRKHSRGAKSDLVSNSKSRKTNSDKGGPSASSSGASDSIGLRRSSRETLGKKGLAGSPTSVRKPDEGGSGKRSSEPSPSPLRRSDRTKTSSVSGSLSGSKKLGKSSNPLSAGNRKGQKEKSVTQLNKETHKVGTVEKGAARPVKVGMKQDYIALYGISVGKPSAGRSKKKKKKLVKNSDGGKEASSRSRRPDAMVENENVESGTLPIDCSENENEKGIEQIDRSAQGGTSAGPVGLKRDQETETSKRKGAALYSDTDSMTENVTKKLCISMSEVSAPPSPSEGVRSSSVGTSSKTPRCCEGRGCKRSYHISCLDPPSENVPSGVWYCLECIKKKLESGIHSVSEGIESIWDVREADVLFVGGLRKEKEFFVKYKGLAHIHNRWIPESKLLLDAPSLVAQFNRENQDFGWKQEWTVPHSLLQKRLLMSPKERDLYLNENVGKKLDCEYEWLVKWTGLDDEHVTWELDNIALFKSHDGLRLIQDYEKRHNKIIGASSSKVDKIPESQSCELDKLSQLQPGTSSELDRNLQDRNDKLPDSSRFREYWVPIQMADLQLEQYCATLISNSAVLCGTHKNNIAGPLREVVISSRKCCDHPYIVNENTPDQLSKGLPVSEYLNFGINASGKFQFLDMMLTELKKQGLRALILLQELGKAAVGDLLDDFLRQRFGPDSYERIVVGIQANKRNAALNKFNNGCSQFVLLMETRACVPSIKLSSINTVIIFGSDWNPLNDMKFLQRVTLDPSSEQIPVFRLFLSHTLEEKILSLTKQEKYQEIQNVGWYTSHVLLMWGVTHQLQSLEDFHRDSAANFSTSSLSTYSSLERKPNPSLEHAIQEVLQLISSNGKYTLSTKTTILSVQKIGESYRTEYSLPGELQSQVMDEGQPHEFWLKLLEGKHPQWKFISGSTQRNRKRVQFPGHEAVTKEAVKKRRKVVNSVDPPSPELGSAGTTPRSKEGAVGNELFSRSPSPVNGSVRASCAHTSPLVKEILLVPQSNDSESERKRICEAQKSLYLDLKPGIEKLCKILELTGDSEDLVQEFLEYMMRNHNVHSDSPTTKQAFQISLIWTAASLLDMKIDHKKTVDLAREQLEFKCTVKEAKFAYSMLRCFKTIFNYRTGKLKAGSVSAVGLSRLARNDVRECVNQIKKEGQKKLHKLIKQQDEEKETIIRDYKEAKFQIQNRLKMESIIIRACCEDNSSMRISKLKQAEISSVNEIKELDNKRSICLKKLESKEMAARKAIQDKESSWLEAVKSWVCPELFGKRLTDEAFNLLEHLQNEEDTIMAEDDSNNGSDNDVFVSQRSSDEPNRCGSAVDVPEKVIQFLDSGDGPEKQNTETATVGEAVNKNQLIAPEAATVNDGALSADSMSRMPSEEQILDTATAVNLPEVEIPSNVSQPSPFGVEDDDQGLPRESSQTCQNAVPEMQAEDTQAGDRQSTLVSQNEPVHEATTVSEPVAQELELNPLTGDNPTGEPLRDETPLLPSSENHASRQVSQSPAELPVNIPPASHLPVQPLSVSSLQSIGLAVGLTGMHNSSSRTIVGSSQMNYRHALPVPSSVMGVPIQGPPMYCDPLQKELEQLSTDFEITRKKHDDKNLELKSEREKKLEEAKAKINEIYDLKHLENEQEFVSKRNEFEERHRRVQLNKFLAEAFRAKCAETKQTQPAQQIAHSPMQRTSPRPPLHVGSSSLPNRPPPRIQTRPLELNSRTTNPVSTPPSIPLRPVMVGRTTPPPPPPLPPYQAYPATTRPPQIGSFSFSNGAQMSTRPPHLRSSPAVPSNTPPHLRGAQLRTVVPETPIEPTSITTPISLPEPNRSQASLPSPIDLVPIVDQLRISGSGVAQSNRGSASGQVDVVYLSDDD